MITRPESDEALVKRMLPGSNPNLPDRAEAWSEWQAQIGGRAVLKFIRTCNNTAEPDEDILQDALLIAYLDVEAGRYEQRAGVPFTAYVKGIARNKIREARRRRAHASLEGLADVLADASSGQIEAVVEQRQRRSVVRRALKQLPQLRRRVLEGYIFGASTAEIAAELHISEDLVRQHKCRGVRSLQQQCAASTW